MRREINSPYAWFRLAVAVLLSAIGGVGMWSVVVALPAVQAEFRAERGAASLPFTLTMIGFGVGGVHHGPAGRPQGHRPAGDDRRRLARRRLSSWPSIASGLAPFAAAYAADRHVRHRRDLRAADGRHLVLVREAARHRRRAVRLRQLRLRRVLADGDRGGDPRPWLAHRRIWPSASSAWW